jgi:ketosteroid isomerase-like protein
MGERDNAELVKDIYLTFAQGKLEEMLQMFSDDLDFQHPMPQSIWPWAGRRRGRRGLAEFFGGISETLEYERLEPHQFIAQDDSVAVVLSERTRVKATGVFFEISEIHLFKLRNGEVVQLTIFEDTAPIIAALRGYRK